MADPIKFYRPGAPYYEFTNFFARHITVDDMAWSTNEHYYQAMKSDDPLVQAQIRLLATPREAKEFGQKVTLREGWDRSVGEGTLREIFRDPQGIVVDFVKDHFMYLGLVSKYTQHADLGQLLLDTGDAVLIEDAPKDFYWGCGSDGTGQNKLGRMLMLIRTSLLRRG